jgi:hypothetical protein
MDTESEVESESESELKKAIIIKRKLQCDNEIMILENKIKEIDGFLQKHGLYKKHQFPEETHDINIELKNKLLIELKNKDIYRNSTEIEIYELDNEDGGVERRMVRAMEREIKRYGHLRSKRVLTSKRYSAFIDSLTDMPSAFTNGLTNRHSVFTKGLTTRHSVFTNGLTTRHTCRCGYICGE